MTGPFVNACLALAATGIALWLRPWRTLGSEGPPWTWMLAWALLPLLWGLDRYSLVSVLPPMSGAALLVLLAGWPLAVLAFVPVAVSTVLAGHLDWTEVLHRLVWLGVVPATLVLAIGAGVRRWLPNHLFVYILGRGFFGTLVASTLATAAVRAFDSHAATGAGDQLLLASTLLGLVEASLTAALTSGFVAFMPRVLATYSDRLYLPRRPRGTARP